jgi:hypothetical protein
MNLTIELPDESVARLQRQAAAHGVSLKELVQELAQEKAQEGLVDRRKAQAAAARIREIQKRSKPDPEGLTVLDYIHQGRRP